jgi:integrase
MTPAMDDRSGAASPTLDACALAPTRTPATIAQYRKAAAQLIRRSDPDVDGDDVYRLAHAIDWFASRHGAWSKATIRYHRAALRQAIDDLEAAVDVAPAVVGDLIERLSVTPTPKGRREPKLASARKRKSFKQDERRRLVVALSRKHTSTARLLAGLLFFGPQLGLRPIEWRDAVLRGDGLFVRCAKNTNGRGLAPFRALTLSGFDQRAFAALGEFLAEFKREADRAGCWQRFHERLAKALARACAEIGVRKIALYTLRHCALATAKRAMSPREVAAFAGHASVRTAQQYYAKRRQGWRLDKVPARPAAEMAAKVRGNARGHFAPGRGAALHP